MNLKEIPALHKAGVEGSKDERMMITAESTQIGALFDGERVLVVDFQEKLAARGAVTKWVVQDSHATLVLRTKILVKHFSVVLNRPVRDAFWLRSLVAKFPASTVIEGITPNVL